MKHYDLAISIAERLQYEVGFWRDGQAAGVDFENSWNEIVEAIENELNLKLPTETI